MRYMAIAIGFSLTFATGCDQLIRIDRVQLGPDHWPESWERTTTQPSSTDADEALDAIWRVYK